MELEFSVGLPVGSKDKDEKSWRVIGVLLSYGVSISSMELGSLTLVMKVEDLQILNGYHKTPIVKIGERNYVRVGGGRTCSINEISSHFTGEFIINGFYSSYEDASAAEMRYQMEG